MPLLTPNIFTFDAYPYEELQRPGCPEEILQIEKAIRLHLSRTLQPQNPNHHDTPPVCVNVHEGHPDGINQEALASTLMRNFTVTSGLARASRMEKIIRDGLTGISGNEPKEEIVRKLSAMENVLLDGTLCIEIFDHPACGNHEFMSVLEKTRARYFHFFADVGLTLQPFHPLKQSDNAPEIPPVITLRRMHKGDSRFLTAGEEIEVLENIVGARNLH